MTEVFATAIGVETVDDYQAVSVEVNSWAETTEQRVGGLALGILMNSDAATSRDEFNHKSEIYPLIENILPILNYRLKTSAQGLSQAETLQLIIHYNTDTPILAGSQLRRILLKLDENIARANRSRIVDGVQVNGLDFIPIPRLQTLKLIDKNLNVIMQINQQLLDKYEPAALANLVGRHSDIINGVWFETTGDQEQTLDANFLWPYIEAMRDVSPATNIGVAGGLAPDNLEEVLSPLLVRDRALSWSAQSGVKRNVAGVNRFDQEKAASFLIASAQLRAKFETIN